MVETSARLLKLLSLLQLRREWASADLAGRLGVAVRTVRRDVDRLRTLGYPVDSTPGVSGGYRLGSGAEMPPLLLDDEEAVAVAVGLRTAAGGSVTGIEETSVRALAKLEQVLPARLRHRVTALSSATVPVPVGGPTVDSGVLTAIAATVRDHERLRFDYVGHDGGSSRREVEPHRLVNRGRRWYLVAWDVDRSDWRTFRVDRMTPKIPTGPRFAPRSDPGGDVADFVNRGLDLALWRYRASLRLHAPAEAVAAKLPVTITVEPESEHTCVIHTGADSYEMIAVYTAMLDVDFDVLDPPEFAGHLRRMAARYVRAAESTR
ncbi:helix-turn-helix transcriptional regulator [Jiangella alkaliphila]|uniref:Predicted DNA-binding transcriptional regulator YafY, contains an HTH and WYL domains n=1 Tax=Jiangella alkaliphila TaxID=419479 RepID=A0A1H2IJG1_9ACTN|nr:YafY family protein [Jiangella alkaliphila]SDU44086.1 Predicted DNA-binding transcriptional regulator YafY, contains an HTH and WYL domains [Jiangella alkaliphila]